MAQIEPLNALYYDLEQVGSLGDVISPPYDVIDADDRAKLLQRSPHNVVEIDLPQGNDPYKVAEQTLNQWIEDGTVVRDTEPAIWALRQQFTGPDGAHYTRLGFLCSVRIEDYGPGKVRPHERTHPGPKEDRLKLTRATKANLSPIFALYSDPDNKTPATLDPILDQTPWSKMVTDDGTEQQLWRISDPSTIETLQTTLADSELLIADGHHRYETVRVYAEEVGGEGPHRYVLMYLVALEDPGLAVFPTHRLANGLTTDQQIAIRDRAKANFELSEATRETVVPNGESEQLQIGYMDSFHKQPLLLTLKDQAIADQALANFSQAYRELDTAVLESLFLKGALGMSEDDISHLNGLWYSRSTAEALELLDSGEYDACFFMGPVPVSQIRAIAAAGENMPPKSTFFYPKVPTGLVFNPLS